jgi:hypothetical protein
LYGDYIAEHRGDGIVESESGFATYRFVQLDEGPAIYLVDIYVRPELRKSLIASDMADKVCDIGREKNCKYLMGSVAPKATKATDSLKVLLAYGMTLHSASEALVVFKKEL